jgi:hypothetical protein
MVLCSSEIQDAKFKLGKIFSFPAIKDRSLHIQRWGHDLNLMKGLLSSLWQDITAPVSSREAEVFDSEGAGIGPAEFLRLFGDPAEGGEQAAVNLERPWKAGSPATGSGSACNGGVSERETVNSEGKIFVYNR